MNKLDLLRARVRSLEVRLDALEARRPRQHRRVAAPKPSDAIVAARERLWARYIELEMRFGHGRTKLTKLAFATKWHLNPDEFCRFFSASDRRGIPEASEPARSFYRALADAVSELEARARNANWHDSHGKILPSQNSEARWQ